MPSEAELEQPEESPKTNAKSKNKKIQLALLHQALCDVINKISVTLPTFPWTFRIIEPEPGKKLVVEELPEKVLRVVADERLQHCLVQYTWQFAPKLLLTASGAEAAIKTWKAATLPMTEEIAPIAQKSQDVYCYHRLEFDFDMDPEKSLSDCPTFGELMLRMTNDMAARAWIGSLFDPNSDRQQYWWLYGEGDNGKSSLAGVLNRVFGPAARSEQVPENPDKFWTHGLLNKRLVVFPDCNNFTFPQKGIFKALTGDDGVRMEEKQKASFSAKVNCKFMFHSNERPGITSAIANRRRAIYSELGPITHHFGKDYEALLWAETPIFLGHCINMYRLMTKDNRRIWVDDAPLDAVCATNEDIHEAFVSRHLVIVPDTKDSDKSQFILSTELQDLFTKAKMPRLDQLHIRQYLERKHGVVRMQVKRNGINQWRYKNCLAKEVDQW